MIKYSVSKDMSASRIAGTAMNKVLFRGGKENASFI